MAACAVLLEAGADTELRDAKSETALDLTRGDDAMAKMILNATIRAEGEDVGANVLKRRFEQFVRSQFSSSSPAAFCGLLFDGVRANKKEAGEMACVDAQVARRSKGEREAIAEFRKYLEKKNMTVPDWADKPGLYDEEGDEEEDVDEG